MKITNILLKSIKIELNNKKEKDNNHKKKRKNNFIYNIYVYLINWNHPIIK